MSPKSDFFALENIYRVNCHNENMTKPFDYLVHKHWCQDFSSWWHWHFHWHEYLLLRNELSILSKWHAFAGYQLGFAVWTNCFEKCINCCANVNSDVRNAPKRLRKTVTQFNWTTRTHCTNTTYLLSLDTIQCTSTTLHMNNLLHLCTSICCSTNLLLIYNLLHLTLLLCIDYIMYR